MGLEGEHANYELACYEPKENEGIVIAAGGCTVSIGSQKAGGSVSANYSGTGNGRTVGLNGSPTVSFTAKGLLCGFTGIAKSGTGIFNFATSLTANKYKTANPVGFFLSY